MKLGNILIRSKIPVNIEDNKLYKRVTIKTKHQGITVRDYEIGSKIGTKKQFLLKAGQFVLSKIDAMYGAFGIAPEEVDGAIITGNFWAYDYDKNIVSIEWLNHFTNSPDFYDLCRRASTGITHRKYLDEHFFLSYEVNLPDLEEQKNIVVFIDGIRKKVSTLEDQLTHQLTLIDQLNQAILQEAVQGKLVPQDPNDEPASELLKRIKAEKAKSGKKEKPLPPIKPEEIPFDIPKNWVWCRLGEIIVINSGDGLTSYQMDKSGPFPVYGGNGITGYHNEFNIESRKIVIGRVGAYCGAVHITEEKAWVTDNAFIVSFSEHNLDFKWLYFILKALNLNRLSYKGNQPVISGTRVYPLTLPLPPLAEQKRIVAEIEKQFAKTRQLKEHILANQQTTGQLLKALLHQAF